MVMMVVRPGLSLLVPHVPGLCVILQKDKKPWYGGGPADWLLGAQKDSMVPCPSYME
jgi:hypothetical protein